MANINSVITYNANLSPAQAQIKALTGQIAGLTAAFNSLDKSALAAQKSLSTAFATNVGQIGGFTAQTVQAHNAVENFGKQLAANRLTMRQYFREAVAGYTKQNSLMKQLAAQQVRYQQSVAVPIGGGQMMMLTPGTISATGNAAAMAAQKFSIFNQLVNGGATAMLNWGKNTQWAGRQLMVGFTVPLMMFTALASKQFRELDKELTRFQKVYGSDLGGAISQSTAQMREEIQSLAFEISRTYGIAAKETAALAADIAATGQEGEDLLNSVQQTTRLAVLGEVDRQEAMKATLALQSAFRLDTNQLAESINFLNAVENQTSATLEDLATAIPKVGPVVRSLGGDVEDLATLLVAMREGGIPAAEAANALKSGLASLINPTKQASEVAKKFGIDLVGLVEANKGQLMPTIFAMRDALAGLDDFGRSRVIEQIFGKYQFARISALFDNIGRNGSQTQAVLELAAKSSTDLAAVANQEIKTLTESTAVRFQRALEDLKNAIMPVGQALTETLIPIFQKIGEGFRIFADFFQALPEPVKNFAKYGVAIAALAGPVIMLVGLFGNLIANGIKFGMMIVRLGAKISGLRVEKFELLNTEVMAAKFGVDNLTTSFTNQEAAMKRLVGVMSAYETSLRRLTTANPALFIPGAIPGRGGAMPVRRQTGSMSPEKVPGGYGGGDKVPALLEPGEMVVRKEAVSQFGPIISEMNRGTIRGFQEGGATSRLAHLTASRSVPITSVMDVATAGARRTLQEMLMNGIKEVKVFSNLVVNLSKATNDALNTEKQGSGVRKSILAAELQEKERWSLMMKATGTSFEQLQPTIRGITASMARLEGELINDPQLYKIVESELIKLSAAGDQAARRLLTLSRQYGTFEYLRTQEGKVRPGRAGIGVSTSGVGSYRGSRLAADSWARESLLNLERALDESVAKTIQSASPSKRADFIGEKTGQNVGNGVINGLNRGLTNSTSRKIVAGPIGPGLESRPLADATRREISARNLLEKALIKETQQTGLITDTKLRMQALQKNHNITLENWTKDLATGQWVHKDGMVAGKARTTALEKLAQEEQLLKTQEEKLRSILAVRERAEKNAMVAADAKAAADKQLAQAMVQRGMQQGVIFTPGSYMTGGASPYAPASPTSRFGNLSTEERRAEAARRRAMAGFSPERPGDIRRALATPAAIADNAPSQRGVGAMNAAMAISMAASTMTMFSGATGEAAGKLMMFTTALTTAIFTMQALSQVGIGGKLVGGVSAMGRGVGGIGARMAASGGGAGVRGLGSLLAAGGGAIGAGGGAAIAATAGVGAAIAAVGLSLYLYKKSLTEARERAMAAFKDPVATVEFFGKKVRSVTETLQGIQAAHASQEFKAINDQLREAVKSDYSTLIEKIKNSAVSVGAADLGAAYTQMVISGLTAEEAMDSIKAIAAESGTAGGAAYAKAFADGLFRSQDPEQAFGKLLEMIDPNSQYNRDRVAALQTERAGMRPTVGVRGYGGFNSQQMNQIGSINEAMQVSGETYFAALKASIELSQSAPELVAQSSAQLREGFLNLSTSGGGLFGMGESAQERAFDEFKNMIGELKDPRLNQVMDSLQNATPEAQALAMELVGLGGNLDDAATSAGVFDQELAKAAINNARNMAYLNGKIDDAKNALMDFATSTEIEKELENSQKAVENLQDQIESYTKSREKQRKAMEDSFDASQEGLQNEIDALNKEQEAIRESADLYIDSLEKKAKADSFYSGQRKTAFSALEKLASGDVFGFLQEREQLSQQAQEFAYDKTIQGIEDRRDMELDAIDKTINKKEELMDLNQKAHDDQMEMFDKETEKHSEELEKRLQNKSANNADMKDLVDGVAKGEIESFQEVRKAFGLELALKYKDLVAALVKETSAKLQAQIASGEIETNVAKQELIGMYESFYGPGIGYGGVSTYDQLVQTFEISPFREGRAPGKAATGGYINNGKVQKLQNGGGGKVTGPGGPKSDVIPALLSNGEYVIQASSVNKYGTDLMHSINAEKFADGGLVQSMEKYFPKGGHQFYSGWNKYNSWAKGKPQLVTMHHTALQPGVSQQTELDAFAKDWKGKPVVQSWIGKSGVAHTLAAGNTGFGHGDGTTKYMKGETELAKEIIDIVGHPNSTSWQMEVSSAGKTQDFTSGQFDAIARMTAAIRDWAGWPGFEGRIINHKDWAGYRTDGTARNDTLYPISTFVKNAEKIWEEGGGPSSGNNNTPGNPGKTGRKGSKNSNDPVSVESPPKRGLFGVLSLIESATRKKPGSDGSNKPDSGSDVPTTPSTAANAAIQYARQQLGKPYSFNAQPPDSWDCSKLTAWSWNQATGKSILTPYSHTQATQLNKRTVGLKGGKITGLSIGDVLYFKTEGPSGGHTSIYAGGDKIVQASSPSTGVITSDLNSSWNTGINPKTGSPRFQWAGPPKGFAMGGFISGPGGPRSDMIPAMLSNGEYVVKSAAVNKYGKGFMDQLNAGNIDFSGAKQYASGGMIGVTPTFGIPQMETTNASMLSANVNNNYSNASNSSVNNSNKINIVINGAGNKSANAIANKVISMINQANNLRDHSRSAG